MSQKIYSLDDWKNGVIHDDLKKRKLPKVVLEELKNVGQLSELLYRKDFLSEKDYQSIEAIMKDTFFRVLEHNVQQRIEFFKQKLDSAYKPDLLLEERINELTRKLEKTDNYYREQAYRGEWSKIGLDYETYQKINDENYCNKGFSLIVFTPDQRFEDRLGGFHIMFIDKYYLMQNVLFDVSEIIRFREKLIELRDSKNTSDKRKEGFHKKNKTWVIEKYREFRAKSDSDNEAVEQVMTAYKSKFDRKISKSTVQRFADLI